MTNSKGGKRTSSVMMVATSLFMVMLAIMYYFYFPANNRVARLSELYDIAYAPQEKDANEPVKKKIIAIGWNANLDLVVDARPIIEALQEAVDAHVVQAEDVGVMNTAEDVFKVRVIIFFCPVAL